MLTDLLEVNKMYGNLWEHLSLALIPQNLVLNNF